MNIVLEANLAGATVTREDGAFFVLGSHNPETLSLWESEGDIKSAINKLSRNENVWQPFVDPAVLEQERLEVTSKSVRVKRVNLIADTDWMALSDNTLTPAWATYRQALRDITNHVNFPYLTDADWPVKPQ